MSSNQDLPAYLRGLIDYVRRSERTAIGMHSGTPCGRPCLRH